MRTPSLLAFCFVSLMVLLVPVGRADAQPPAVTFESLELHREEGRVLLAYEVAAASWPRGGGLLLDVSARSDDRGRPWRMHRRFRLDGPAGRIALDVRGHARVELRLSGGDGSDRLFDLGAARVDSLELRSRFATDAPAPEPPPSFSAIAEACDAAFDGDTNEDRCIEVARTLGADAPDLIRACEAAFDGDANELACLGKVAHTTARIVRTCEEGFDGDANELACIELVSRPGVREAHVLEVARVCQQRSGDSAELECMRRYLGP